MTSNAKSAKAHRPQPRTTDEPPKRQGQVRPAAPYVLPDTGDPMLRVPQVAQILNVSLAYAWSLPTTDPTFPRPIRFSPRCTRISGAALREWIAEKAAARGEPKRQVVDAARKSAAKRRAARAAADATA